MTLFQKKKTIYNLLQFIIAIVILASSYIFSDLWGVKYVIGFKYPLFILGILLMTNSIVFFMVSLSNRANSYSIVVFLFIIFSFLCFVSGNIYQRYYFSKTKESYLDQLSTNKYFNGKNKFVILRDDDVGFDKYYPVYERIYDDIKRKDAKMTLAVQPELLAKNALTREHLSRLPSDKFEIAVHGFNHAKLSRLSYNLQIDNISQGVEAIIRYLNVSPTTMVPPHGSGNLISCIAANNLGFKIITDVTNTKYCTINNYISDLGLETDYNHYEHISYSIFKTNFDQFIHGKKSVFIFYIHSYTFLQKNGEIDLYKYNAFLSMIDYMKKHGVIFLTYNEYNLMKYKE